MDEFLIIRLSSLGDIIHALPAFAALRKGFPAAKIAWIVEKAGREILDLVPGLDEIIVRGEEGCLGRLRNRNRISVDFQGLLKSAVIGWFSGARKRIGFSGKNLRERSAGLFYTDRLPEFLEDKHVIDKNLRLLSRVGLKAGEGEYEFPLVIPDEARRAVRDRLSGLGWQPGSARLVICNVGAAWENKRWPQDRWIEFLKGTKREGFFHILLWGNAAEREAARSIGAATGIPEAPFLSIREVLALIAESSLLISGDTFALQAACALNIPVLGIFGPTNPRRNGPFRVRDRTAQVTLECRPCYLRSCESSACITDISAAAVEGLVRECLEPHA